MEDQPVDSGDLTDTASVPQGKAARSRHRLPRQKAQATGQSADATGESVSESLDPAVTEPSDVAETTEATETEAARDDAANVEPTKRRRLPWRRRATVVLPAVPTAANESDPEPVVAAADEDTDPMVDDAPATAAPVEAVESESVDATGDEPEVEPVLVPHQPAGRGLKCAAVAMGVLFVAAGAFAGATLQPYLADRAAVQTKFAIAETAANAITTLWTYTPDDMDTLPDRSAKYLGGDFATDYRRYIDAIIEPNKQAKVTNDTQVLGVAVESLTPTEASALVYTNSVATSPVTKGIPSLRYLSYRLTLEARNSQWLITRMTAVTSLDLTPRL